MNDVNRERARLAALKGYNILDTVPEIDFDRITELASLVCNRPVSLVSLSDSDRQWFKSAHGIAATQLPREGSFCDAAIRSPEIFEVPDATADDRFREDALVTGAPHIRSYCGAPLIDDSGYALGTLCVIGTDTGELSDEQRQVLQLLAREVVSLISERRSKEELVHFEKLFNLSNDLICIASTTGFFKKVNPAFGKLLGYSEATLKETPFFSLLHPDDRKPSAVEIAKLGQGNMTINFVNRFQKSDGEYLSIQWAATPEPMTGDIFCIGRDITEELARKAQLRYNERHFRDVFENSQGIMCTHDLEGNLLSINSAAAKLLGYDYEELLEMSLFDLVQEERHDQLQQYLKIMDQKGMHKGRLRVRHKDGSTRIWLYNNVLSADRHDNKHVIGNALDITDRYVLELQFNRVKEMLEETNKVARIGGWELDLLRQHATWSGITREIHEVPRTFEVSPENIFAFYKPGKSRQRFDEAIERVRQLGGAADIELQIVSAKGRKIWVRTVIKAQFEGDDCLRLYGSIQDIDEKKRQEMELLDQRSKLSSFVTHAPAAVAMLDREMCYIAYSNRWLEEYRLNGQILTGLCHYDVFPNITDDWKQIHQRCLAGEVIKNDEDAWIPDGWDQVQYLRWEVRPWFRGDGSVGGIMMFTQDITENCMQREELKRARKAAEHASIAKSEFLANMSHEIRTPLNGVIGFTDLLLKTPLDDTQRQYLGIVNQSATSLLGVINDILDFSKIEAGKLELDVEQCDLFDITSQAVDIVTYQAQKKGLEILLNVPVSVPRFLHTDNVRLKQVLVNLMGNAVKFTDKGEVELKVSTAEVLSDDIMRFRFEVRDTGIGIKKEMQAKIFEAFSQEDASTTKRFGGTGLGLTISNNLLKLMGTQLQLSSEPGKGTTFFFELETRYEHGEAIAWESPDFVKRVLIVDDNENNRLILQQMLALKGVETDIARHGYEALQMLTADMEYDVVMMDYHMPFMNGLDTIKKMRETFRIPPEIQRIILFHSSLEDESIIKGCQELKVDQRLLKPVKMQDMYEALNRIARKRPVNPKREETITSTGPAYSSILLADDNKVNILLASTIIEHLVPNVNMLIAENGREAVEIFKKEQPDLIFMDVQMPEMNGCDATREIRKLPNGDSVPIIALTAGNATGEREKCIKAGMNDFVAKPFTQETLKATLERWSKRKTASKQTIDEQKIYEYLGDSESSDELIVQLLTLANKQIEESQKCIRALLKNEPEPQLVHETGHKLYGTATSSGLTKLAEKARELELTSLDGDKLKELLLLVDELAEDALKEIARYVGKLQQYEADNA